MSLLGDTIRDAHRPLPGGGEGWLRQVPFEQQAEGMAREVRIPAEIQTVSRFQKEGPSPGVTVPREASFRPGETPPDDPLSVESKVERPNLSASGVNGNEDIFTDMGENQGNELATGQVNHRRPRWTTAAKMSAETSTHQSEVMSGPNESGSAHQRHQSREQQGSVRFVSEQEETYQSRIPGQGAPSESFFTAPIPPLRSESPGPTPAGRPNVPSRLLWPAEAVPGHAVDASESEAHDTDAQQGRALPTGESVSAQTATAMESAAAPDFSALREVVPPKNGGIVPSVPQLVIGRIDVVVVARQEPASVHSPFSRQSDSGFVSRNYLKRL